MKKCLLCLVTLLLTLGVFTACQTSSSDDSQSKARTVEEIKQSGKIVIGVFSDKKPFGYVDSNGDYQGYDV